MPAAWQVPHAEMRTPVKKPTKINFPGGAWLCMTLLSVMYITALSAVSANAKERKHLDSAAFHWLSGLEAAHDSRVDSALSYLRMAHSEGISDDSLYYLWAETFLYKGVYDTALALNFSIKSQHNGELYGKALKQRYLIYSALGWESEAKTIYDSLQSGHTLAMKKFLPECDLYISSGVYAEKNLLEREYPFPRPPGGSDTIIDGILDGSLRLAWSLPLKKGQDIRFGAGLLYRGSRFGNVSSMQKLNDSTDMALSGFVRYSLLSNRLSFNYSISRTEDFLDRVLLRHQWSIRSLFITDTWFGSLEAGYRYRNPSTRHYYYLRGYADRLIGMKSDLSFSLMLSGIELDDYQYGNDILYLYVKDSRLYFDSLLTPVTSVLMLSKTDKYNVIPNECSIPQSFLGINPQVRYERQLSERISTGCGLGYFVTRYRKPYIWMDLHMEQKDIPTTGIYSGGSESYLVYDLDRHGYYWIDSIASVHSVFPDPRGVTITRHSMRRVDQTLSLDLFFTCSIGRAGDVEFNLTAERNFSTLSNAAPVDIQKWYGEATVTWYFNFKPDKYWQLR